MISPSQNRFLFLTVSCCVPKANKKLLSLKQGTGVNVTLAVPPKLTQMRPLVFAHLGNARSPDNGQSPRLGYSAKSLSRRPDKVHSQKARLPLSTSRGSLEGLRFLLLVFVIGLFAMVTVYATFWALSREFCNFFAARFGVLIRQSRVSRRTFRDGGRGKRPSCAAFRGFRPNRRYA